MVFPRNLLSLFFTLFLCFGSWLCKTDTSWVVVERFPSGEVKAEQLLERFSGKILRRDYYQNGKIRVEYGVLNNKLEGEFRAYYENGNLKKQVVMKNGMRIGIQCIYYESGGIESISNVNKDKVQGFQYFYYEDGRPLAVYYRKDGVAIYEKKLKYSGTSDTPSIINENFYPIVTFQPDSLFTMETSVIRFSLPLPEQYFDMDSMKVSFAMIQQAEEDTSKVTHLYEGWFHDVQLSKGKGEFWLMIHSPGPSKLVGRVVQQVNGKERTYDFFTKWLYVHKK